MANSPPDHPDINPLCARCIRRCRQPASVRLLECPRFKAFPFKIEKNRFEQLSLFDPAPETTGKGKKKG